MPFSQGHNTYVPDENQNYDLYSGKDALPPAPAHPAKNVHDNTVSDLLRHINILDHMCTPAVKTLKNRN